MTLIVLQEGKPIQKIMPRNDEIKEIIPFFGIDIKPSSKTLGIGYVLDLNTRSCHFWNGPVYPCLPIQMWRAFQIFKQVPKIEAGTLYACWNIAERREIDDEDKKGCLILVDGLFKKRKLEKLRRKILTTSPTEDELDKIAQKIHESNMEIESWEIEREAEKTCVRVTPLLQQIYRK